MIKTINTKMHIQGVIQQLGYKLAEAKVYMAALSLGESTIVDLAHKTKLPRTTVQSIVEKLHKDGLLNAYMKRSRRVWMGENPEKLMIKLKENEAALKNILPELQAMRYDTGIKPVVKLYTGSEEIKKIMNDMLETKHHISGIISWDDWREFFGDSYVDDFIQNRFGHFLKIRLLTMRTKTSQDLKIRDTQELRTTKFLPAEYTFKSTTFIYANKVAIISLNSKLPTGILIEDVDITNTITMMFNNLWANSLDA